MRWQWGFWGRATYKNHYLIYKSSLIQTKIRLCHCRNLCWLELDDRDVSNICQLYNQPKSLRLGKGESQQRLCYK